MEPVVQVVIKNVQAVIMDKIVLNVKTIIEVIQNVNVKLVILITKERLALLVWVFVQNVIMIQVVLIV